MSKESSHVQGLIAEVSRPLKGPVIREMSRLNERLRDTHLKQVSEPTTEADFNTSTVIVALKSAVSRWAESTSIPRHLNFAAQRTSFSLSADQREKLLSPIFVVGCGHSGTSIMLKILDNHSKIFAIEGESDCFIWFGLLRKLRLFLSWNSQTLKSGAWRWAEKTPKHLWYLKDVFSYFPNAKVIIMLRDGRDVALSQSESWGDFDRCAQRWLTEYHVAKQYESHPNVTVVRYEDLVKSPFDTLTKLFEFLGEDFEPEVIHTERVKRNWYADGQAKPEAVNDSTHSQNRNWQINQPLTNFSNRWVTQMTAEEKKTFKEIAGPLLIELGYAQDLDW